MEIRRSVSPITGSDEIARVRLLLEGVVDDPYTLNLEWLRRNQWVAVPGETDLYQYPKENVVAALTGLGCSRFFAPLFNKPIGDYADCFSVQATQEGLEAISRECRTGLNYAFVPDNKSFVVITTEEYFVIAGPKAFVERALGQDIATAREEFEQVAKNYAAGPEEWSKRLGGALLEVSNRYKSLGNG